MKFTFGCVTPETPQTYCNSESEITKVDVVCVCVLGGRERGGGGGGGQKKDDCVTLQFEKKKKRSGAPRGKERLMFELKAAGVYHHWHFSATQSGQLLHIESNNEKNATPLPPPLPHSFKSPGPMPTSAGSQPPVKTRPETS